MERADTDAGARLGAQALRLRLLLRHLAGAALRERVELDDLVQEVFLRVLSTPGGLPPAPAEGAGPHAAPAGGDAELWRLLVHVARHVVVDVARAARAAKRGGAPVGGAQHAAPRTGATPRTNAAPRTSAPPLPRPAWSLTGRSVSQLAAVTAGPATRAAGSEFQERLERAFTTLSAEHRRVLGLRQLQGLSAEEAGARMGRSATAVHSLYRRALLAWEQAVSDMR